MPERVLQKHNCVAALQHRLPYNVLMSLSANEESGGPVTPAPQAAGPRPAQFRRIDLVVAMLLVTIVLTAACSAQASSHLKVNPANSALAFVACMRTHGEPNMPDPVIDGRSAHISIQAGSGVDPRSPRFIAAVKACRHLIPAGKGGIPGESTITPADQADYLKAVACMRTHGYPKFPEPVFSGNSVSFNTTTPIDTKTSQYERALAICDKLIPAGLPYSGRNPAGS
jgi:hypothetical protein